MTRKETTEWLYDVLFRSRFSAMGTHVACEVLIDMQEDHPRRIDVMQFKPVDDYVSSIEGGDFICYEVKSCIEDVYSGYGLGFIGNKNYIVTTLETYKRLLEDMAPRDPKDKFGKWYEGHRRPDEQKTFGVMIACPKGVSVSDYFTEPEKHDIPKDDPSKWSIQIALTTHICPRKRSTTELLYCMLRAKENGTTKQSVKAGRE